MWFSFHIYPTMAPKNALYVLHIESNSCPHIPILSCFQHYATDHISAVDVSATLSDVYPDVVVTRTDGGKTGQVYLPLHKDRGFRETTLIVENNCAYRARQIMTEGSYIIGLTSTARVGAYKPNGCREIVYVARIDRITNSDDAKLKRGFSNHYWYFGGARPLAICDDTVRQLVTATFDGYARGCGRESLSWTVDCVVEWFLKQNIPPGIHGLPRQKQWHPQMNDSTSWMHCDLNISATVT